MLDEKICSNPLCQKIFMPSRYWQIYCSRTCNMTAYFLRKTGKKGDALDALDIEPTPPTEPSELQIADRERRMLGREELEQIITTEHERKVFERTEKILEEKEKGNPLERLGYGSKKEEDKS